MEMFLEVTQVLPDDERLKVLLGLSRIVQIHEIYEDGGEPKDGSRTRIVMASRSETFIDVEETYTEIRGMLSNPGGLRIIERPTAVTVRYAK